MWLILTFFFVPGILSIKVYKDIVHGEVFVEDWEPHKNVSEHIVEFAAEMAPYYFAANYDDYGEFRTEKVRDTRYEIDKVVKHHWREVTYRSIDDVKQKFHYDIIPYAKNYHLAHGDPLPETFEDDIMNFLEDLRFKYIRMFISRNATRHDQVYIPLFVEMTIIRARLTPRVLLIKELYDLVEDESKPQGGETAALDELKNAQKKIDKTITDLAKAILPNEAAATTSAPVTTTTIVTTVAPKTETQPATEAPAPGTTEETATEATTEIVTEETPKVEEVTTEEPKTTTTEEPTTTEATTEEAVTEATEAPEVTEETTTEEPATEETVTEETVTEEPATEEPATEEPATEEPVTEESVSEPPATEEPTVEETTEEATEAPETETPPETETVGEEETTEESVTEEAPTEETATEETATEEKATEETATETPDTLIEDSVDTVDGGRGDGANDEEAERVEEAEDFAAESPREVETTYSTPVEPGPIILLDE